MFSILGKIGTSFGVAKGGTVPPEVITPAMVLFYYLTDDLALMSQPDSSGLWPLYVGYIPDIINDAGVVYDTEGLLDGRIMRTGLVIKHQGIDIGIRAKDYDDGFAKIIEIADALDGTRNVTVTIGDKDYLIRNMSRKSDIIYEGVDEKRRFGLTIQYNITIEEL
jgi:hypothetical protein